MSAGKFVIYTRGNRYGRNKTVGGGKISHRRPKCRAFSKHALVLRSVLRAARSRHCIWWWTQSVFEIKFRPLRATFGIFSIILKFYIFVCYYIYVCFCIFLVTHTRARARLLSKFCYSIFYRTSCLYLVILLDTARRSIRIRLCGKIFLLREREKQYALRFLARIGPRALFRVDRTVRRVRRA